MGKKIHKHQILGWVKHPSPKQLKQGTGWFGELDNVYRRPMEHDNEYIAMFRTIQTEFGEVKHVCIRNTAGTDIPWVEKQKIKNELFGKEAQAIEVFPKESLLVDEANMYHLWILPDDYTIPFGLK